MNFYFIVVQQIWADYSLMCLVNKLVAEAFNSMYRINPPNA